MVQTFLSEGEYLNATEKVKDAKKHLDELVSEGEYAV